jgi:hypothetical protein
MKLTVSGSAAQRKELLALLQLLTDDTLSMSKAGLIGFSAMKSKGKHLTGTALIRLLVNHKFTTTVAFQSNEGSYAEATKNLRNAGNGIGTNVFVGLNKKDASQRGSHLFIILGHELIHSLAIMNGSQASFELVAYSAPKLSLYSSNPLEFIAGSMVTLYAPLEEALTVGLISGRWITENSLRRENGFPSRRYYPYMM